MMRPRIVLLADTPNLYRSAMDKYGPDTWADYRAIQRVVRTAGEAHCEAIVNDGVAPKFVEWLKRLGYEVTFSHAEDVDEMLIARAVALHQTADHFVIASGDGKNADLIRLFHATSKRTTVAAIGGSIHHRLEEVADEVVEFPVRRRFAA